MWLDSKKDIPLHSSVYGGRPFVDVVAHLTYSDLHAI
jgi:hypothetical protein